MALTAGTELGPYEILAPLGAGGMGEVYRAVDTRLDRTVAIKVLPAHLSSDAALKQRLEREAKTVSKLSHPHICTLHDIGHQDGIDFLVMEYLEGETLEQRLIKGPLPPEQTLRYAAQVADALAKAHKLGITHRDLKPANIMLTKSGAKLMDFGLAKESGPAPLAAALTEMTLEQAKLTSAGIIVGTFQYMAPEQLEGKEADARTDIFALGEVIYEMATGKPAFSGKSRASLIAAILTTEPPPITQLQPITPVALEHVVQRCLAKDPDDRWQSAGDLASELKWIAEGGSQAAVPAHAISKRRAREYLPWALASLGVALALVMGVLYSRQAGKTERLVRAFILPEENTTPLLTQDNAGPVVLSPDGSALAYVATDAQGRALLWVRKLSELHARSLAGTDGGNFPFWSADSRSLGFFSGGKLKTVSFDGGPPTVVCDAPLGRGGTWNAEGTILFSPTFESPLYEVSASGGTPRRVTTLDKSKHDSHRWPHFLPDGKHFLYLAISHSSPLTPEDGIYFGSLDGKDNRMLLSGFAQADYSAGYLLFVRDTALVAQLFNRDTGSLEGTAVPIAEQVLVDPTTWRAAFSVADRGMLAYVSGGTATNQLTWYDRSGKSLGTAIDRVLNLSHVHISPDGRRVVVDSGESLTDIWTYDVQRQVSTRLTFGPGNLTAPVWSPDGKWIAYNNLENGHLNIYRKPANGMGQQSLLLEGDATNVQISPNDWSPDGKSLIYVVGDMVGAAQLWELPLTGDDRKPRPFAPSNFIMMEARFSPDSRWIAYTSNESGRFEVYVIPSSGSGGKWQISTTGGQQPVWRRDGREIFYLATDNSLMSVPILLEAESVEAAAARRLFPLANTIAGNNGLLSPYDVTPDGKRFLVVTADQAKTPPITLVTNWTAELRHQ
jgi:Tol biopolymer transport system component